MQALVTFPFDLPESGRYVCAHVIGIGGMGRVAQAFDRRLSRDVARTEVTRTSAGSDSDDREHRLVREASIRARLEHPGIVPVHDAGRLPDGNLDYATRIARGTSLAAPITGAATANQRHHLVRHDAVYRIPVKADPNIVIHDSPRKA